MNKKRETNRRTETTTKNHSTKTIKLEGNSEVQDLRASANSKLSNRNATIKKPTPAFAKPYPIPIRFPSKVHTMMNQPVPVMMFPRNSPALPYIPNPSSCVNFENENDAYGKKPIIDSVRYKKINSNEYSCSTYQSNDYRSKPRWENHNTKGLKSSNDSLNFISDGNSSTPKKQKVATRSNDARILADPLSTSPSSKHENVDTQNVLEGLDNLDMDFSDNTITVASIAETKDAQKLKENIQNEFKNSVQLIAKKIQNNSSPKVANENFTEGKENCKYGKDLVEKVALNVIGSEKDNEVKISSKVNHFPSCPLPTLSGGWPNAPPVGNQYNVPYYDMNENLYPKFMASPLFGNPIWNNPNAFTNSARDN
ncbi:hypothetical protein PMKS-003659 [Pichia membranifaciens]|uniref:Uncharacterized protein n=1 Tax=Pichia membranifaciens TaxID=4926 RepID=A0A1Q2YKU0_9ASCO|nr:hypothetical protein PMKS-003659 [Pichia membranifaciens]